MAKPASARRARPLGTPKVKPTIPPATPHTPPPPPPLPSAHKAPLWAPLLQSPSGSSDSVTLSPNDHTKMLVELLQRLGPELVRRWVASLLTVDRDEREAMVDMVEKYVAEHYPPPQI